jgi:hypothetical protein
LPFNQVKSANAKGSAGFLCLDVLQFSFELLDPRSHGIQLSLDCGWYLLIGGTRWLIL